MRSLSTGELRLRQLCAERLAIYIRQRAAHWKQRGKCRALKEGDSNTKYFHARASQRLRRNKIRTIEVDGIQHTSHAGKTAALTKHYATLLGQTTNTDWSFDVDSLYAGCPKADAAALVAPFTATEALQAVSNMNAASAPGPDGVGPSFYTTSWNTTGAAIMDFLHAFHRGDVNLDSINRAHIVLIPKRDGAISPDAFRPISLQNCPVKILTKLLTTRLQRQIPMLVDMDQTGFIRG
ncbi:unnamed protein product [Urochloa humidicola]